jgi:hypothetical protein
MIATMSRRSRGRGTGSPARAACRNVRVFTRYWLALIGEWPWELIGEWPWEKTPNIPPEVVWFSKWFTFSIQTIKLDSPFLRERLMQGP